MLQKLKKGDKIALIAPSGAIQDENLIKKGVELFKKTGFELIPFPTCSKKYLTFAGKDEEKLSDIQNAFKNKEIKAILCARGGYGAIKLINKINYKEAQQHLFHHQQLKFSATLNTSVPPIMITYKYQDFIKKSLIFIIYTLYAVFDSRTSMFL